MGLASGPLWNLLLSRGTTCFFFSYMYLFSRPVYLFCLVRGMLPTLSPGCLSTAHVKRHLCCKRSGGSRRMMETHAAGIQVLVSVSARKNTVAA